MTDRTFDRAVESVARRQHGVVCHNQALVLGGSDAMCSDRVLRGDWVRMTRGVYALASAPPTWKRQYKAAELSKPGSSLRRRSAALVHGFEGARVLRPELLVPAGSSSRSALATVCRARDEVPTVQVDGFRVTSVAQTLWDLAGDEQVWDLERWLDGALLGGQATLDECRERLDAYAASRRPQRALFAALVDERSSDRWAPPESELEARLAGVLARLPPGLQVVRQAQLPWRAAGEGRVDVLVVDWRLILEADGRRWHARVADFDRDRWRDNEALAHGYRILRFTHTHIDQRPEEIVALILAAASWRTVAA